MIVVAQLLAASPSMPLFICQQATIHMNSFAQSAHTSPNCNSSFATSGPLGFMAMV